MTDIEYTFQFGKKFFLVKEIGISPVDWMAGRCLEAALASGLIAHRAKISNGL
jgi:hypothetical protein